MRNTELLQQKGWMLIVAGIVISLLLHLPFLNRPPESQHIWRQCNTLAVARNFQEEEMNILRPRVDQRNEHDGVTGMQFPLYEYCVALVYGVTGEQMYVHRLFSFLLYAGACLAMYAFAFALTGNRIIAAIASWSMLWSPEFFYHGINALPDVMAMFFCILSLWAFSEWRKSFSWRPLLASAVTASLAGLVKLPYLSLGFFILGFVASEKWIFNNGKIRISLLAHVVISCLPSYLWYQYSIRLIRETGLADFGLEVRTEYDLTKLFGIVSQNVISEIPEIILGYGGLFFLVLGIAFAWKKYHFRHAYLIPVLTWATGLLAYYLLESRQMLRHPYYMFPLLPLFMLIAGAGGMMMAEWKHRYAGILFALLLLIQPVQTALRILPSRWMNPSKQVPAELYAEESRARLRHAVPDDARVIVGPDMSGCIWFWYLHKKGFGYHEGKPLHEVPEGMQKPWITTCVELGACYLYTNDTMSLDHPEVEQWLDGRVMQEGKFVVWRLKKYQTSESSN